MTGLPAVSADIARAISAYGAAERAFARRCVLEEPGDTEINAVIETALALDIAISLALATADASSPAERRHPAGIPLCPQWRGYLPS